MLHCFLSRPSAKLLVDHDAMMALAHRSKNDRRETTLFYQKHVSIPYLTIFYILALRRLGVVTELFVHGSGGAPFCMRVKCSSFPNDPVNRSLRRSWRRRIVDSSKTSIRGEDAIHFCQKNTQNSWKIVPTIFWACCWVCSFWAFCCCCCWSYDTTVSQKVPLTR